MKNSLVCYHILFYLKIISDIIMTIIIIGENVQLFGVYKVLYVFLIYDGISFLSVQFIIPDQYVYQRCPSQSVWKRPSISLSLWLLSCSTMSVCTLIHLKLNAWFRNNFHNINDRQPAIFFIFNKHNFCITDIL